MGASVHSWSSYEERLPDCLREVSLASILDSLVESIGIADINGVLIYSNKAFTSLTGYSPEEVRGRFLYELLLSQKVPNQALEVERMKQRYQDRREGKTENYELTISRKDGELRLLSIVAGPLRNSSGKIIGSIGALSDITRARELQTQLMQWSSKMETVGCIAGGFAHDFNNLLCAISGYSEMLLRDASDNKRQTKLIASIQQATTLGTSLAGRLLTFSGRNEVQAVPVDLNDLITETLSMLRASVKRPMRLSCTLSPEPLPVLVDKVQIQQVMLNLVLNARDAIAENGQITLTTEVVSPRESLRGISGEIEAGKYAVLSVTDNGCGIPEDILRRLPEPFLTSKQHGTGLGLSTVWGIVRNHRGLLQLETCIGKGTEFRVYFPLFGND